MVTGRAAGGQWPGSLYRSSDTQEDISECCPKLLPKGSPRAHPGRTRPAACPRWMIETQAPAVRCQKRQRAQSGAEGRLQ